MCIPLLPLGLVLMVLAVLRFRSIPVLYETSNCIRCRYSLEGLPRAGMCPECGRRYDLEDQTSLRKYRQTPRERMALDGVPMAVAFAAAAIACAVAKVPFNLEMAVYGLIVGLVSVLPPMIINHAADGRVRRRVAWTIAIAGSVPAAVLAALTFGSLVNSQQADPYSEPAWAGVLYGLTISTLLVGFMGAVASHDAYNRARAE
jgi:hypothetical protein